MITKESIEQKLRDFEDQRQKLLDSANAVTGAIQLCQIMLQELQPTEAKE